MTTPFDTLAEGSSRLVYVRPVLVADLPPNLRDQVGDLETVYSVHDPNGKPLALVADRQLAFNLALSHDLAPQSVH